MIENLVSKKVIVGIVYRRLRFIEFNGQGNDEIVGCQCKLGA